MNQRLRMTNLRAFPSASSAEGSIEKLTRKNWKAIFLNLLCFTTARMIAVARGLSLAGADRLLGLAGEFVNFFGTQDSTLLQNLNLLTR